MVPGSMKNIWFFSWHSPLVPVSDVFPPFLLSRSSWPLTPSTFANFFYWFPSFFSCSSYILLSPLPVLFFLIFVSLHPLHLFPPYLFPHQFSMALFPTPTTLPTSPPSSSLFRSSDSWPLCITETLLHTLYCGDRYMGHEYSYFALCALHTVPPVQLLFFSAVSAIFFFPKAAWKTGVDVWTL